MHDSSTSQPVSVWAGSEAYSVGVGEIAAARTRRTILGEMFSRSKARISVENTPSFSMSPTTASIAKCIRYHTTRTSSNLGSLRLKKRKKKRKIHNSRTVQDHVAECHLSTGLAAFLLRLRPVRWQFGGGPLTKPENFISRQLPVPTAVRLARQAASVSSSRDPETVDSVPRRCRPLVGSSNKIIMSASPGGSWPICRGRA